MTHHDVNAMCRRNEEVCESKRCRRESRSRAAPATTRYGFYWIATNVRVPFHEVRTRFLGNIASPATGVSPIKMVERLWGGELPEFDSIDAANELIGALVMGLWNRLARHQDRRSPFRLIRTEAAATREGLAAFALVRQQELDGFIEGLFGSEEKLDFPERAHRGLGAVAEIRSLFAGVIEVALDETRPGTSTDVATTVKRTHARDDKECRARNSRGGFVVRPCSASDASRDAGTETDLSLITLRPTAPANAPRAHGIIRSRREGAISLPDHVAPRLSTFDFANGCEAWGLCPGGGGGAQSCRSGTCIRATIRSGGGYSFPSKKVQGWDGRDLR